MKVTVDGDRLTIDFTGSDTRQDLQAWSTFGNTRGYMVAQIASMMDPEIPKNEGFFDSIELIVPEGCVLNPLPGKTVAAGTHHPGVEVGEVIARRSRRCCPSGRARRSTRSASRRSSSGSTPTTGQCSSTTRSRCSPPTATR